MSRLYVCLLGVIAFSIASSIPWGIAWGGQAAPPKPPQVKVTPPQGKVVRPSGSCTLMVKSIRRSGIEETRNYLLDTKTRAECEKAGKLHETVYDPDWIERKEVKVLWNR